MNWRCSVADVATVELTREAHARLALEGADPSRLTGADGPGGYGRRRLRRDAEPGARFVEGEGGQPEPVETEVVDAVGADDGVAAERAPAHGVGEADGNPRA